MFRRWLSGFWRDYKEKIIQASKVFGILIAISVSAAVFFSAFKKKSPVENVAVENNVYTPSRTIISGKDISKQEFEKEENLLGSFVDYCNQRNFEAAYNLLTDECKENVYPTLDSFVNEYCNFIFQSQREYNMQSWVNNGDYKTYRVRYTENYLDTGEYNNSEKYEDYVTIVTDEDGNKKLSINGYIGQIENNVTTKLDEIEATVPKIDVYKEYIVVYLYVKNKTDKQIQLDKLEGNWGIKLLCSNGAEYSLDLLNLTQLSLNINPNAKKQIKLKFKKQYGSNVEQRQINFKNVILDYEAYLEDSKNYNNYKDILINL